MKRAIATGILVAGAFVGGYAFSEYAPETVPVHKQTETFPVNSDNPIKV